MNAPHGKDAHRAEQNGAGRSLRLAPFDLRGGGRRNIPRGGIGTDAGASSSLNSYIFEDPDGKTRTKDHRLNSR